MSVAAASEVGRTGMLKLAPVVLDSRDDSVAVAEHNADPQARSVAQQPPPRLDAHDLKPGEQIMAVARVEVEKAAVGEEVDVEDVEDDEDGRGASTTGLDEVLVGVVSGEALVLLNGEAMIVGLTKTVDVETRAPEDFRISYG